MKAQLLKSRLAENTQRRENKNFADSRQTQLKQERAVIRSYEIEQARTEASVDKYLGQQKIVQKHLGIEDKISRRKTKQEAYQRELQEKNKNKLIEES
jgi:hypothetical protein